MATKRPNLGRGLDALLGDEDEEDLSELDRVRATREIPIEQLEPGAFQPRRRFDADDLATLADSIREKGVLQPILVRRSPEDLSRFEIIAGERRWRAAQAAHLHEVPVVIRDFSDRDALEIALVENVQRRDLTILEEAHGYRRLMDEFGHTQEDLAKAIGKSRSHIANTMRLLALPEEVQSHLDDGRLTPGHARALLGADDPVALAAEVIRKGLTVRKTEQLAAQAKGLPERTRAVGDAVRRAAASETPKDADTLALEREISNTVGMRVEIDYAPGEDGRLTVHFHTLEQLDELISKLTQENVSDVNSDEVDDDYDDDEDDPLMPRGTPNAD